MKPALLNQLSRFIEGAVDGQRWADISLVLRVQDGNIVHIEQSITKKVKPSEYITGGFNENKQ